MAMRIVIVEDEAMVARRLVRFLEALLENDEPNIRVCDSFASARRFLKTESIDLLFLDLNLHGKDGFALLAEATTNACDTIVVSANTDRAIEAFDIGVLDFVAKPFSKARLEKALLRYRQRPRDQAARALAVRMGGDIELVALADIIAIHGADNYAELETRDGRRLLHDKRLDHLEAVLPEHFVRVHRSHIVDWREVAALKTHRGSKYSLLLKSGTSLPVSRRKMPALRQLAINEA